MHLDAGLPPRPPKPPYRALPHQVHPVLEYVQYNMQRVLLASRLDCAAESHDLYNKPHMDVKKSESTQRQSIICICMTCKVLSQTLGMPFDSLLDSCEQLNYTDSSTVAGVDDSPMSCDPSFVHPSRNSVSTKPGGKAKSG